jgi:hypothetical protein
MEVSMSIHIRRRRGLRSPLVAGAVAALGAVTLATAPQAQAKLMNVSTGVEAATGFPGWYSDQTGTRLKLCVDSDYCLGGNSLPDPDAPASVATGNLPDEAFYSVTRAETALTGGGRIRWRAVLEGAFANDEVVDGDQMTFTRVQITGDKINTSVYPVGTVLTFRTPYGDITAPVGAKGKLSRDRTESDPGDASNGFRAPISEKQTPFDNFLRWDTGAPAGYLGNPAILHKITGGVRQNFQVFQGAKAVSPLETRFEVAGQIAN